MSQNFRLKAIRIVELSNLMESIPTKDLQIAKDIKLNVGLVNDLNEANKEIATKVSDLTVKRDTILKPYQVEFSEKAQGLDEVARKELEQEIDKRLQVEQKNNLEALLPAQKEIDELAQKEVVVELSDDKHAKLKEWFVKYAPEKNLDKKVFVEVANVLGVE